MPAADRLQLLHDRAFTLSRQVLKGSNLAQDSVHGIDMYWHVFVCIEIYWYVWACIDMSWYVLICIRHGLICIIDRYWYVLICIGTSFIGVLYHSLRCRFPCLTLHNTQTVLSRLLVGHMPFGFYIPMPGLGHLACDVLAPPNAADIAGSVHDGVHLLIAPRRPGCSWLPCPFDCSWFPCHFDREISWFLQLISLSFWYIWIHINTIQYMFCT